jgi:ABC-type transport system substrate-binding protein
MTFPMFRPIPQAKDTKDNYKNNGCPPVPYMMDSYTPGTQLKLKKNPNWDANTDPVATSTRTLGLQVGRRDVARPEAGSGTASVPTPPRSTTATSTRR